MKVTKNLEKTAGKVRETGLSAAVELMKVLSHPVRLSILCNLIHNGEMTAGEIVEAEVRNASQSQVSQYLGILRSLGYVKTRREGQTVYYEINDRTVKIIVESLYNTYCGKK
jgi:DNA-binding transcriptional ArsR family regulator